MQVEFVTSVNDALRLEYADKTMRTWQQVPEIFTDEELDQDAVWRAWREKNTHMPNTPFEREWRRFSYKAQAQCRAYHRFKTESRYMIWMDADVRQLKCWQAEDLAEWLPQTEFVCWLGRGLHQHPETGFIAYDLEHVDAPRFFEAFEQEYVCDHIWSRAQWHDAYVWNCVRLEQGVSHRDLGPGRPGEAFGRSVLRRHWQHLKGARKYQCID